MGRQLLQKKMNHIKYRGSKVSRKFPTVWKLWCWNWIQVQTVKWYVIIIIIIIILVLQPGSSLECLKDTSPVHSVRCLVSSILILRGLYLLGLLDNSCFRGWGSQPPAQPQNGGSDLRIYISRRQGSPATRQTLGILSIRLFRQVWTTLGLFLFPATSRENNKKL
jgi:hypothetical protein